MLNDIIREFIILAQEKQTSEFRREILAEWKKVIYALYISEPNKL